MAPPGFDESLGFPDAGARVIKVERAKGDSRPLLRPCGGSSAPGSSGSTAARSPSSSHQGCGGQSPAAAHHRPGGRLRSRTWHQVLRQLRFRRAPMKASPPHHRRHQRLWRTAPSRDEGTFHPVRIGDRDGDREPCSPRAANRSAISGPAQRPARSWRRCTDATAPAGAAASGSRSSTAWRTDRAAAAPGDGGNSPARTGLNHAMIAPYGAYPVGDGGQMVIAIQNAARVGALLRGHPGRCRAHDETRALRRHPAASLNRPEMDALIAELGHLDMDTLAGALRGGQSPSAASTRSPGAAHPTAPPGSRRDTRRTVDIVAPPARHGDGEGDDRPLRPVPAPARTAMRFGGNLPLRAMIRWVEFDPLRATSWVTRRMPLRMLCM